MYQRPEVRLIEPQQEQTTPVEVTGSEAAELLAKYGYKSPEYNNSIPEPRQRQDGDMTVEEFFLAQQREIDAIGAREHQRMYGPKAVTFDSNKINYSNTEFRSLDDDSNFGIQVQIVSDMPIYNNRR